MSKLKTSITTKDLCDYLHFQILNIFPDNQRLNKSELYKVVSESIEKIELCFSKINTSYYNIDKNHKYFNHLNGDHYSSFLYQVARLAFLKNHINLAEKIFNLNKMLHGIDIFYTVELPNYYIFIHPIGTVIGTGAKYSDYLVVYQGVSVGANENNIYPSFSEKTILFSNSSVLGNSKLGHNVTIGARSTIINQNVPNNSVIVGNYPNNKIFENKSNLINNYFLI